MPKKKMFSCVGLFNPPKDTKAFSTIHKLIQSKNQSWGRGTKKDVSLSMTKKQYYV